MNQMNMHGNIPANPGTGSAPNMGMHMSPASAMMQQQPGPGAMMPQQPGAVLPQQAGAVMPQQSNAMMQQQSGPMMQQQPGAMIQQQPGPMMQQPSPQQLQPGPGPGQGPGPNISQQPPQDKMDNISKVKTLAGSLRDSISLTLKAAAQDLHQNLAIDSNTQKPAPDPNNGSSSPRFDKNLEEFYGLCDQMELHLRTAVTCIQQAQSAGHYLPLTVIPSRLDVNSQETTLSYPSFLSTVRLQISYAKDIHDTLVAAAQNIAPAE